MYCHLQTFMWFVLKFTKLPKLFHLNHWKLIIFSQLLKEFDNSIECWHGTPSTSGRTSITTSSGCATNIPTFSNIPPSNPLVQQFLLVACTMVTKNDDDGEGSPFTLNTPPNTKFFKHIETKWNFHNTCHTKSFTKHTTKNKTMF